MIADDNVSNLRSIEKILKRINIDNVNINLKTVDDGDKAVDYFKLKNKYKNNDNIHMIIMDYNMNKMNGNEATKIVIYIILRSKI